MTCRNKPSESLIFATSGSNNGSISPVGYARLLILLFCSTCLSTSVLAQTQLGADIDGEAADDLSGRSVSFSYDGNRLAIGATGNDGNGSDSGHARVLQWSGTAWTQLGADIDGEAAEDTSGYSVSLSSDGNRLAIGARWNSGFVGHVRVYEWSGTAWTQLGNDIDGEAQEDYFGWSVSLSSDGNRLAVGAPLNDGNGADSGHVRIYQWSGETWEQRGLDINGEAAGDRSGTSVSLSSDGNRVAIGAHRNRNDTGHVRVYQWSDAAWIQLGGDIDGAVNEGWYWFGRSVSISSDGNRLAIGAPRANQTDSGLVGVYEWSGSGWGQVGEDITGEAAEDHAGESVSLSSDGNRLAIGARDNDGNGDHSGHVRVYHWSETSWTKLGADIDGEAAEDWSSYSISLSPEGDRLAIGAPYNDGNGNNSGHVRVYDLSAFDAFLINSGLNDAWYYPATDGQGFFITVFPELGYVSLAWFTYDTEFPPVEATANLGDPGHRWLTAVGPIDGNQVVMNIEMTSGGIFDTSTEIIRTDPPGSDGTLLLTFDSCTSGTIEYDIPSINRHGIVPIERVADDNIVLCEALKGY